MQMVAPALGLELVLASTSPRRRDLLAGLGIAFRVHAPEVDERRAVGESPARYVQRVAQQKAAAVADRERAPGHRCLVLAADTSVVLGDEVFGKPENDDHARAMLSALSGRTHTVLTAIALDGSMKACELVSTEVELRALSEPEIRWYVSTGEPGDKAGAYALQGRGALFVKRVSGSPTNVIGLPLVETASLLDRAGLPLPWGAAGPG